MNLQQQFSQYLFVQGYSQKTIKNKQSHLVHFLNWYTENPLTITTSELKKYYSFLFESKTFVSTRGLNSYMTTLKQFYTWCCDYKLIPIHPFGNLILITPEKAKTRKPVSKNKITALYKACDTLEEKILMILGYGCGLRSKELVYLKVSDILFDKNLIVIRNSKYNQTRYVPVTFEMLQLLQHFIRQQQLVQQEFLYQGKSEQTIRRIFKQLQDKLQIRPYYTLHQLRHSIASHLADNGVSMLLLQQFLGHRHLKTTQNYIELTKPKIQ